MPQTCSVCKHPKCEVIDKALLAGGGIRDVAGRHGLSKSAVDRHKKDHIHEALVKAREAVEVAHGDDLLAKMQDLAEAAHRIREKCEKSGDWRTAISAIRELTRIVEIQARMAGELHDSTVNVAVSLTSSPEWVTARGAILRALEAYPDARGALVDALTRATL